MDETRAVAKKEVQINGEKTPLTKELIVDVATQLIDEQGLEGFTMRSLGKELGVSAMACYGYFSSREELLAAVLTKFMSELDTDPIPGERWDDTLRRTMHSIHDHFMEHPNMEAIDFSDTVSFAGLAQHTQKIVQLHLDQGMPQEILARCWAMVDAYLTGFNENAIAMRKNGFVDAENLTGSDSDRLPLWLTIVEKAYTESSFDAGVDMIIAATRALAAPDPCEWYTPENS